MYVHSKRRSLETNGGVNVLLRTTTDWFEIREQPDSCIFARNEIVACKGERSNGGAAAIAGGYDVTHVMRRQEEGRRWKGLIIRVH